MRTSYKVLADAQGKCGMKPLFGIIKELASKENRYGLPPHIFSMLHYVKMYDVLENNPLMQNEQIRSEFEMLSGIDALMGTTYELKDIMDSSAPLFTRNQKGEVCFFLSAGYGDEKRDLLCCFHSGSVRTAEQPCD